MATATTDSAVAARRFAVACGLLSHFVKAAGPVPMSAFGEAARVGAVQEPGSPPADRVQQLTILYGGRVVVLDGCTPARAAELIRYAAAAAASPAETPATAPVDIPIARKASLQRFLSKRKDRSVASTATEETALPPAKKGKTEASSWLALGSLGDMHAQ
jgi:jasmonate ZIM domain-containing protein